MTMMMPFGVSHTNGVTCIRCIPTSAGLAMSEVTNNMNSYYNVMRMGHTKSDKIDAWPLARKHFVEGIRLVRSTITRLSLIVLQVRL